MPSREASDNRRRRNFTAAGPVTVRRSDGSSELRPAYTSLETDRIIERGRSRPLTADEMPESSVSRLAEHGRRFRRRKPT